MVKRHIQGIPCKILFLDDIFIGLDIANRLPLLHILADEFPEYQIFITTYDSPWYEYVKSFLEGQAGWTTLELYAQTTRGGYEVPRIQDRTAVLAKAKAHFDNADYKAAAVYTRSTFEMILRRYCEKKRKKIAFKSKLKDYTTQDFWTAVESDVQPATKATIEQYRGLVLNPFSHYNTEKHEVKTELAAAIQAVETLRSELDSLTANAGIT